MDTLVDLLRRRANDRPDFAMFRFLRDGESAEDSRTLRELDRRARAIGARLREIGAAGTNVLMLFPPGIEFIDGYFGCLYAGAVPVPAYPPEPARLQRTLPRVQAIVADARARFAMTTKPLLALADLVFAQAPDLRQLEWLATDAVEDAAADRWAPPPVGADTFAMMQYTSGSTGTPKGVMLTHANLMTNADCVFRAFEFNPDDRILSWLPTFHDMGFMSGVLQPLYSGCPVVGLPPTAFLEKPFRWLAAIHANRITVSGGPNFAYDLCVRKTTPEQRAALDLSTWKLAYNGAETVRLDTIERFAETFAKSGFRRSAMYPCFGLAEATLIVSGGTRAGEPVVCRLDKAALEAGRVQDGDGATFVSCGRAVYGQTIAIVDVDAGKRVAPDRVGEIWVSGPTVGKGYWQRPDDSEATFRARLADDDRLYLRTGDLGFVRNDELYVCGRAKDLIIIRGANHYPQDIELTVERAHPAIRPGCVAAFSVQVDDEERVAVVAEVDRRYQGNRRRLDRNEPDRRGADLGGQGAGPEPLDVDQLFWIVRDAIAARHEIEPDAIVLVRAGSVPKTSSGKLQRRACRQAFAAGELEVLAESRSDGKKRISDVASAPRSKTPSSQPVTPPATRFAIDIEALRKPSILVVPKDRELLARSLAHGHFAVVGADTAGVAVELARKTKFAVAISDDLATLAKIAEASPHTARLMVTDFDDLEAVRDALNAGRISGVLAKRAGPQQIHAAVAEAVDEWVSHQTDVAIREIEKWLAACLAERLQHNPQVIDLDAPVTSYGLDSLSIVEVQTALADWLGQPVPDTLIRGKASIRSVARRLASATPVTDRISRELPVIRAEDAAIAIVGMGCAVPGARDLDAMWRLIRDGVDAIAEVPADRLQGGPGTRWAGAVDGVADFDPAFFGIAPRDAAHVDPQHRLLLETTWQALEDAGICPQELAGTETGVFVGLSGSDFLRWQPELAISDAPSAAAQRISYFFNLKGPSFVIDSGDASSMAALHLAVTSLQRGECKLAIAAGVSLTLTSRILDAYEKALLLAKDGRCKPLDVRADGSVLSDGCGVVVLRRATDARASANRVRATILATAIGQNGRGHGLTAPNEAAQEQVIREAVRRANIRPSDVGYVELNARGLPAVDGIEVRALASVIAQDRAPDRPCVLGSLKANIGDSRAAAGMLGVIKAALVLEHDELPRLAHLTEVHRDIALGDGFVAPTDARPWTGERRIACVDDFGLLGTNGVAVLAAETAAPRAAQPGVEHPMHVLCVSARSEAALRVVAERYAERLAATPSSELADVCFTANIGRAHFVQRAAIVASNPRDMRDELAAIARGELRHPRAPGRGAARIAFLFTGRGVAAPDMARQLFAIDPRFRSVMQRCDRVVRDVLKRPLLSALYPVAGGSGWDAILEDPAMVAVEYALADLWQSWGIYPDLVMGHDVGEYAAAAVSGALGLEEAVSLACHRARLLASVEVPVAAATVVGSEAEITAAISAVAKSIAIAEHNGPRLFGVVGAPVAIQALVKRLATEGIRATIRPKAMPLHTPLAEPILDELAKVAARLQPRTPSIPLISNVTGKRYTGVLDAAHWRKHSLECVQFERGLRELIREGSDVFLEIGPRAMLAPVSTDLLGSWPGMLLASLDPKYGGDWEHMLSTLGALYERGVSPNWNGFYHGQERKRVAVPSYPFERKRCWPE